jgi:hypothetical protein
MPSTSVKKDAQRPERGNLHADLHLLIRSAKPSAKPQTGNSELSATNTDRHQSKECGVTKRNETTEARRGPYKKKSNEELYKLIFCGYVS